MKHRILYLLFFLNIITSGYAQDYKKAAEQQFLQYTDLIIKKDFRSASEFIIEDMFEMISKEQMILAMEKIFNMPEFEFKIDSPQVLQISNSKKLIPLTF
ncbi:hypothetical protein [Niabella ginsengisoli]|uniref:Uncharacterized protein n=1 Tax=Niabella ginsengisoli TaxID=522298 RepID=A0ABS9SMC8_9BACT|nr:hypothetical protein [Niabella ginsengisoli]MCH5599421.1 hypothetical protein [Niabella ginsengisoli]